MYFLMIRLRLIGGFLMTDQWIPTDCIALEHTTVMILIIMSQTLQAIRHH
ncbi:MAG: hypothetical protein ACMUEM_00495 [Flavobacteriales bacterium AspAUS03]